MATENLDFDSLNRKGDSIKSRLTRLKKYIYTIKDEEPLDDVTILKVQQKINRFDEILPNFNEIQNHIELFSVSDEVEKQYGERENFVNILDRYAAIARKLLKIAMMKAFLVVLGIAGTRRNLRLAQKIQYKRLQKEIMNVNLKQFKMKHLYQIDHGIMKTH